MEPSEQIAAMLASRREDPEFRERLSKSIEANRPILDRLAEHLRRFEHLSVEGNSICEWRDGRWLIIADGTGCEMQGETCPFSTEEHEREAVVGTFMRRGGDPAGYYEGGRLNG